MTSYPIHEVFHTFQGEGVHMGIPAFFIRTYGCPVHCPWCDSAGTWHKDWVPSYVERIPADRLANLAVASGAPVVVVTGGEPTIHDLRDLISECKMRKLQVHIETSGAFPIQGHPDWITLSPKKWQPPIDANLLRANEFKIIVESEHDIDLYTVMIKMRTWNYSHVWLHPEWSKRNDPMVLQAIAEAVKRGNGHYRAGYQLHKLYQVDALDPRSRKLVPLGGDESKGY